MAFCMCNIYLKKFSIESLLKKQNQKYNTKEFEAHVSNRIATYVQCKWYTHLFAVLATL